VIQFLFCFCLVILIKKKVKLTASGCVLSLPFPVDVGGGGGDTSATVHSQMHRNSFPLKGLTEQQKEGVHVVRKLMHTLDEEGGLEEIYTFR